MIARTAAEAKDLLASLCDYYLDCIATERPGDVSVFAQSKYDPEYVQLNGIPGLDEDDPMTAPPVTSFLTQNRGSKSAIYVGYPVFAMHITAKSGWQGYVLQPLFVFSIDASAGVAGAWPSFNPKALESLSGLKGRAAMDAGIDLQENLVGESESAPELSDVMTRLRDLEPTWPWVGKMDPDTLDTAVQLAAPSATGIFNAAMVVASERPPFTVGLEYELRQLRDLADNQLTGTALGHWLGVAGKTTSAPSELLTPFPLNEEQGTAVTQSMSNELTVVTGPPGTGKSQVVSSMVVNTAWTGRSLLFASKNNQAVDVVADRTNAIGSRPVMLRLGNAEHRSGVVDSLNQMLATKSTQAEAARYAQLLGAYTRIDGEVAKTAKSIESVVNARNALDAQEQATEDFRDLFTASPLELERVDLLQLERRVEGFERAVNRADRASQSFVTRTFWFAIRSRRYADVLPAAEDVVASTPFIDWRVPTAGIDGDSLNEWFEALGDLRARVTAIASVQEYMADLRALQASESLEDLYSNLIELDDQKTDTAVEIWDLWLRLQPSKLSGPDRESVANLANTMKLLAGARGKSFGKLITQFNSLFPKTTSVLSCWGITSLSVRYRLPFVPGFLDSVVIDEASNCDIASALPLLFRAKRATVIGDPQQLPHVSSLSAQQDTQLLAKHGLIDEVGWSYSAQSLFGRASSIAAGGDIVTLLDHYRSHGDIIGYSNEQFYEGRLRVATRYDGLLTGGGPAVRWLDCKGRTVRPANGSATNRPEADAVVSELRRLIVDHGYRGSVGVVTPFRAQANLIKDRIRADAALAAGIQGSGILVDTAHGFQGDERDIILFSTVISDGAGDGALGFLRKTPRLFNVAITRARSAMVVVGDRSYISSSRVSHLVDFGRYVDGLASAQPPGHADTDYGPSFPGDLIGESVSEWEARLYDGLYAAGIKTQPQVELDKYRLDLALRDGDRQLDIEVDGEKYHRDWDGEVTKRDRIRNTRISELGWDVLRFWVYEVRDDLDGCVARVEEWLMGKSPRTAPEPTMSRVHERVETGLVDGAPAMPSGAAAECKHGLEPDQCHICRNPQPVYISGGGTHYHLDRSCKALRTGQNQVRNRGGTAEPVEVKSLSWALADGRDPCRKCASGPLR